MRRLPRLVLVAVGVAGLSFAPGSLTAAEKAAAERGRDILFHNPMNPSVWSLKAYDTVWKQWGLSAKPADHARAVRERYGLHPAPFDNHGLPLGLIEARGLLNKGIVNNCLLCHAGTIAGQTYIGLGNASVDLQGLFEELTVADGTPFRLPYQISYVRGTVDPASALAFLMGFRDPDLNLQKPLRFGYSQGVASDPPAWWQLKKKKTRDWTGNIDVRSTRVDMVNLLTPLNSPAYIKKHQPAFADIGAFLLTVEAPRYPFPVDHAAAARGQQVFAQSCAKCHGTYGEHWTYPNKIVPFDTIGTDRTLGQALRPELADYFNRSWFSQEIGPDGTRYRVAESYGYQAPPLDGVWATAPYFHNGSVPTVYHVLNSKARPRIFTRSYRTGKEDYDPEKLGWKVSVLDRPADPKRPARERRQVYDTTRTGQGNGGHTFGDKLTEDERRDVIEYLKTL